ncbi:PAS domain-containing methyl-accepting chemotaxis protein [Herbaspirillum sp. C9C3]|uniref:methyl-accepting chemotaxis protein n=1 Tax=Herbaspirillum sp. C9C3 TaxID=2735271 RepID=UPI001584E41A|nr:PAS domain-containing methyl-accepting chemotaxis protein [Herbaspirillum sp. C9C3]NUT61403.1 PAS domain-containing protein [Herbaspirillum sp. C9C3]
MRINIPVTQQGYKLTPGEILVSVTDLRGRITYCNPPFIDVSGFSRDELLGQPHNIVRHPDMPGEAFRDMWLTIQSGAPWSGLVKNRRKNGDYYWVRANATPMMDGQRITGYLSVRTMPSDLEIAEAQALYQRMRDEARSGRRIHTLSAGTLVKRSPTATLGRLFKPSTLARLALAQLAPLALMIASGAFDLPILPAILGSALCCILAIYLTWRLALKPLQAVLKDVNRLASGDFSLTVKVRDGGQLGRIQQGLNQMVLNLRTVVSDVRKEVQGLRSAVAEIALGNQDMSARTESQASSLEQTSSAMHEINSTVQQSAASASSGADLARETADIANVSNQAVLSIAATMGDISQSSHKIEEITQVIEGVAFQTNILALNAAVEAARAGEAGRGFAVVATEVRALAHRTSQAAREIKTLIGESVERVSKGEVQTQTALQRMQEALAAVTQVSGALDEIRHSSLEQSTGIAQVNDAIVQMDSITQQNAAMVEELASSALSLQAKVEAVSSSMQLFRLTRGEQTLCQLDAVSLRREMKAGKDVDGRIQSAAALSEG